MRETAIANERRVREAAGWGPTQHVAPLPEERTAGLDEALRKVERQMHALVIEVAPDRLGAMAREHLSGGGKRLRARLCLEAANALEGSEEGAVCWAAACEVLHNATLVHDDLQDGDRSRRGRPSVWARHGAAQAINVGDLLLMLPALALDGPGVPEHLRWPLARALSVAAAAVARGQSSELDVEAGAALDWPGYRSMAAGKTGALFGLAVQGAALLAGRRAEVAEALGREFERVGVLYQLQDDVVDLYGEKGRGAPGSDLRAGKATVIVIEHLARVPSDESWLVELLRTPRERTRESDVRSAIDRFRAGGALNGVTSRILAEMHALQDSPRLAAEPALHRLALRLVAQVLAPIAGLVPIDTAGDGERIASRLLPEGRA